MNTLREAVEYLHWEGLSPKQIVLELQRRNKVGTVPPHMITEEKIVELIEEIGGIV